MRIIFFYILLFPTLGIIYGKEQQNAIAKGAILVLGHPVASSYQHIDFPRKNILIKRRGIANYKMLVDQKLIVDRLTIAADGTTEAVLKRKNGRNFFRFFPNVTANLEKALASRELILIGTTNRQKI